jgi:prepilin-type N-terminal cleavage/methylation domain-containing protein
VTPARRPAGGSDAGMTLVELLVSMIIGSILIAAVGSVFIATLQGTRTVLVKSSTGADVRIATEAMSRTLKAAAVPGTGSAFASGTATSMSFYAFLNRTGGDSTTQPNPTLVSYSYSSTTNCLTESQTPGVVIAAPVANGPSFTWSAASTASKCLLRTTTAPTFSYFSSGATTTQLSIATGLSAIDVYNVRSVRVQLVAKDPSNGNISGVPSDTRITLENLLTTALKS